MTAVDVTIDTVALSTAVASARILRVRRQLLGDRRDVHVDVPGRAGAFTFAEEPGDRRIILEVSFAETSFALRRAAARALAGWADTPSGRVNMVIDDEPDRYYEVVLESAPDVDEWLAHGDAELEFRSSPYAFAVSTSSTSITASAGSASGMFVAADDELVAFPIIEVTPLDGTLTAFELTISGDTLEWTGSGIGAGDTVTVSSPAAMVTTGPNIDVNVTGTYDPNLVDMEGVTGEFPLINPGANTYAFTTDGTATAVRFRITWRARYR